MEMGAPAAKLLIWLDVNLIYINFCFYKNS